MHGQNTSASLFNTPPTLPPTNPKKELRQAPAFPHLSLHSNQRASRCLPYLLVRFKKTKETKERGPGALHSPPTALSTLVLYFFFGFRDFFYFCFCAFPLPFRVCVCVCVCVCVRFISPPIAFVTQATWSFPPPPHTHGIGAAVVVCYTTPTALPPPPPPSGLRPFLLPISPSPIEGCSSASSSPASGSAAPGSLR